MPKIKVRQIEKVIGDVDINGMFEEMMGVKDADPEIIIPKMVNVRNTLRHIYRILTQFSTFSDLRSNFPEIADGLNEIKHFAEEMKASVYILDEDEKNEKYSSVSKEDINNLYRKLKDDKYVKGLIILCNKLDKYKSNFSDPNTFKENFVNQEPGLSFQIFDFSSLDLKILWAHDSMKSSVKRYILMVLSKIHEYSYNLYKTITSPDVDIDKFTGLLVNSISELKQHPELHRCKAAFARIEKSVELLKDKFSDYYRESIASENPNALVTSFIVDVSNQGGADARLTREFRTIIQYMHKVSQKTGKNKDPNVQKIMKMLNHNYSLMERHTLGKKSSESELESKNDISNLDLTLKTTTDSRLSTEEIAEEKRLKRLEKQKAKSSKKKSKSGKGKNNLLKTRKDNTDRQNVEENIANEETINNQSMEENNANEEPENDDSESLLSAYNRELQRRGVTDGHGNPDEDDENYDSYDNITEDAPEINDMETDSISTKSRWTNVEEMKNNDISENKTVKKANYEVNGCPLDEYTIKETKEKKTKKKKSGEKYQQKN